MERDTVHERLRIARPGDGALPAPLVLQPVVTARHFTERRAAIYALLRDVMIEGTDYGTIPGTPKPSLWKPGAEKLGQFFGLTPELRPAEIREEWGTATTEPFLYYKYECRVYYGDRLVCTYTGLAHSREEKYRWRWVPEHRLPRGVDKATLEAEQRTITEPKFAVKAARTDGKYGKPPEYWAQFRDAISAGKAREVMLKGKKGDLPAWEIDATLYRVLNTAVEDLAHTLSAMAQKRAMVGAIRIATNATDIFDVREEVEEGRLTVEVLDDEDAPEDGLLTWPAAPDELERALIRRARYYVRTRPNGSTAGQRAELAAAVDGATLAGLLKVFNAASLEKLMWAEVQALLDLAQAEGGAGRIRTLLTGSARRPAPAGGDPGEAIGDLYPNAKPATGLTQAEALGMLKAGAAGQKGQDVPPADGDLKALERRLKGLGIDAEALAKAAFGKGVGGLSEAHVAAISGAGDSVLRAAAKAGDGAGK